MLLVRSLALVGTVTSHGAMYRSNYHAAAFFYVGVQGLTGTKHKASILGG